MCAKSGYKGRIRREGLPDEVEMIMIARERAIKENSTQRVGNQHPSHSRGP